MSDAKKKQKKGTKQQSTIKLTQESRTEPCYQRASRKERKGKLLHLGDAVQVMRDDVTQVRSVIRIGL